jgi:hypothetical protein
MGSRNKRAPVRRIRSTTDVVNGVVRPKNRWIETACDPAELRIPREQAGRGWKHVLDRGDVERFIALIDDWAVVGAGIHTIRLAEGSFGFGYYRRSELAVRALPADRRVASCYLDQDAKDLLSLLDVPIERGECPDCRGNVETYTFSLEQARAWQLLDVFLHELGHHHDATTNRRGSTVRGERFALRFAQERQRSMWPRYQRVFRI